MLLKTWPSLSISDSLLEVIRCAGNPAFLMSDDRLKRLSGRSQSPKSLVSAPFRAFRRLSQITVKYMMLEKRPRETRRPFAPRIQGFGVGSQNCNLELSNAHIRVEESYDSSGAPVSLTRHSPTRGAI
jgi:hypothetical protein